MIREVKGKFNHRPCKPKGHNRKIKSMGTMNAFATERIVAGLDLLIAIKKLCTANPNHLVRSVKLNSTKAP